MKTVPASPRSVPVDANGLVLHALERNPGGSPSVLFLHGWLDHCHGFDWLCEALPPSWRQVALDFRGQGQSAHLPLGSLYHFTDYLADAHAAVHQLRLAPVHLVGHSLGGSVALFFAAAEPQSVRSITAIESLGPGGGPPDNAIPRLRQFAIDLDKPPRLRTYPSLEAAVARVRERNSDLTERAARHLTLFGTRQTSSGGYEFTFDPAHRKHFGFAFDEEQILAALGSIECKALVIHATSGLTFDDETMKARLAHLKGAAPILIEGSHHVHMDQPALVAEHIVRFIDHLPSPLCGVSDASSLAASGKGS